MYDDICLGSKLCELFGVLKGSNYGCDAELVKLLCFQMIADQHCDVERSTVFVV